MNDLFKHAREFLGYLRNHRWEHTDDGNIYLAKAGVVVRGEYEHAVNGQDWRTDSNLITTEGLVYLLQAAVSNAVNDITAWYLAPYGTAIAPAAGWTGVNFHTNSGELGTAPEGYTEATRQAWTPDAVDSGTTDVVNDASPAVFTMNTATTISVNGCGMLSTSAKSAGTGTLLSASQFSAPRVFNDGDTFNLKYKINADPV